MKLVTAVLAILFTVALFSCRRDYTCECTNYGQNATHGDITRYEKLGRIPSDDATNTCEKIQMNRHYDTCMLTNVK